MLVSLSGKEPITYPGETRQMFLRDAPTKTLTDVADAMEDNTEAAQVSNSVIRIDLTEERRIAFKAPGTENDIEVPADANGIKALGDWLDIPSKFLQRLDPDLQQSLITTMLERNPGTAQLIYSDEGLKYVRNPNEKFIDPRRLVTAATRVIDPSAPVVDHWLTGDEFRLDVIAPENFDRGIGGDPQVGDITRGGIRIGHDIKHNLAPWVSEFAYRLACTNGMEFQDEGLKVDARGASVEEVLGEFEAMADRAFRRVEESISSFYAMRQETVDNPERTLIRLAEERGLPNRTTLTLAERIPAIQEEGGEVSMFDLVNLITNAANDPRIRTRTGARRTLEVTGGTVVSEHADRCGHCQSKLG